MKCGNCGKEIPDGSVFCLHCGTRIPEKPEKTCAASPENRENGDQQASGAQTKAKAEQADSGREKAAGRKSGKIMTAVAVVMAAVIVLIGIGKAGKASRYNGAMEDMESGNYQLAMEAFEELEDYRDSQDAARECCYLYARQLMDSGDLEEAKRCFEKVKTYGDAEEMLLECDYRQADELLDRGAYAQAEACFGALEDYKDSETRVFECRYLQAEELLEAEDYEAALDLLYRTSGYGDAETNIHECQYQLGQQRLQKQDYLGAYEYFQFVPGNYKDTQGVVARCRYEIALDYYEAGSYESAFAYADGLHDYDLPDQYDISFFADLRIRYIEILLSRKDNGSVEEALYLLGEMNSTQQVRNLIKKAENQQKQNTYDDGMYYLELKQYTKAIRQFEKIKDLICL